MPDQMNTIELREVFTPLLEKSIRRDGTIAVKMIAPGWGSSGYYDKKVLERDIPKAFPAGTKMFMNHPTLTEQTERPERDLRDLAAVTMTEPVWQESGPGGPGMYADARVFSHFQPVVDEIAEHIGVSIMGSGITKQGEAEGKKGPIVEEIVGGQSVDFVTSPGAGGQIVSIFESAQGGARLSKVGGLGNPQKEGSGSERPEVAAQGVC